LRLADRADDAAARAPILAEARAAHGALRAGTLLTAARCLTSGSGCRLVVVLRGRRVRVDAALVRRVARARRLEVVVRGAGGGVLVLS